MDAVTPLLVNYPFLGQGNGNTAPNVAADATATNPSTYYYWSAHNASGAGTVGLPMNQLPNQRAGGYLIEAPLNQEGIWDGPSGPLPSGGRNVFFPIASNEYKSNTNLATGNGSHTGFIGMAIPNTTNRYAISYGANVGGQGVHVYFDATNVRIARSNGSLDVAIPLTPIVNTPLAIAWRYDGTNNGFTLRVLNGSSNIVSFNSGTGPGPMSLTATGAGIVDIGRWFGSWGDTNGNRVWHLAFVSEALPNAVIDQSLYYMQDRYHPKAT
jgi:hypothetical protein